MSCRILFAVCLIFSFTSCSRKTAEFGELTRMAFGKTDKAETHGFTEIYEHMFYQLKSSPIRICEIGIAWGGSLDVWSRYFSRATVFGIDDHSLSELRSMMQAQGIKEDFLPAKAETERIKTFVADQANRDQLQNFINRYGGDFDILLDDGGHTMEDQQISFGFLFKYVKPKGYYVIEDVHTSLVERYQGFGADKDEGNTTLTMINNFIRHGRITSRYMRPEEMDYLNSHIEFCNLFVRNNYAHSITCIFQKKADQAPVK